MNSEQYEKGALHLLATYGSDGQGPEFQFLTSILFYLERQYLENLFKSLDLQPPQPLKCIPKELCGPAIGKVRYVSGYIVAKLKHTLSTKIRNSLFVQNKESQVTKMQAQLILLNSMCISYGDLQLTTDDPSSLEEIRRKQNLSESLTNISDDAFDFFSYLEVLCRTIQVLLNMGRTCMLM